MLAERKSYKERKMGTALSRVGGDKEEEEGSGSGREHLSREREFLELEKNMLFLFSLPTALAVFSSVVWRVAAEVEVGLRPVLLRVEGVRCRS